MELALIFEEHKNRLNYFIRNTADYAPAIRIFGNITKIKNPYINNISIIYIDNIAINKQ